MKNINNLFFLGIWNIDVFYIGYFLNLFCDSFFKSLFEESEISINNYKILNVYIEIY